MVAPRPSRMSILRSALRYQMKPKTTSRKLTAPTAAEPLLYTATPRVTTATRPSTVAGCAPTWRNPAKASAAASATAHSTKTATGNGPARKTPTTITASMRPVRVASETDLVEDWRTARPARGLAGAGGRERALRPGASRATSSATAASAGVSSVRENSQGRTSLSTFSLARNDESNWSSWATQSASPSRQAGAGKAAQGSSLVEVSRATTMGTWPVGASVQCGRRVASSSAPASSTSSAAVMTTRESVELTTGSSPVGSSPGSSSNLKKFLLLVREQRVDDGHLVLGHLVQDLLEALDVVTGQALVLLERLELLARVTAHAAEGDLALLGLRAHDLDEGLATLLGEGGEGQADHVAVVGGREAEVGVGDRLLDRGHGALVEGRDHEETGLGHREVRQLAQGGVGAVVVDEQVLDQRRGRPSRAHRGELALHVLDRLGHAFARVVHHHVHEFVVHYLTSVP